MFLILPFVLLLILLVLPNTEKSGGYIGQNVNQGTDKVYGDIDYKDYAAYVAAKL